MPRNRTISGAISPEDHQMLQSLIGDDYTISEFINHAVQIAFYLDPNKFDAFMTAPEAILAIAIEGALPKKDASSCSLQF